MSNEDGLVGDWDLALKDLDDRRFMRALKKELRYALRRIGERFVALSVKWIQGKKFAPNKPATIARKGTSTPLVEHGDLFRSITYDVRANELTLWVGVNRQEKNKKGDDLANIAAFLHEGYSIKVKSAGKADGVKAVPARPFIRGPMESREFDDFAAKELDGAVYRALIARAA